MTSCPSLHESIGHLKKTTGQSDLQAFAERGARVKESVSSVESEECEEAMPDEAAMMTLEEIEEELAAKEVTLREALVAAYHMGWSDAKQEAALEECDRIIEVWRNDS